MDGWSTGLDCTEPGPQWYCLMELHSALPLPSQARMPKRKLILPMVAVAATVTVAFLGRRVLLPALGEVPAGSHAEAIADLPMFRGGRLRNTLPLDESLEAVGRAIFGERAEAGLPRRAWSWG